VTSGAIAAGAALLDNRVKKIARRNYGA
jgi:hypothetical protein